MKTEEQDKQDQKNSRNSNLAGFARYSGLVFQMILIIGVATWGGSKLDSVTSFNTPVFTIILSLLGVFAGIYVAVRDFIK